MKLFSSVFETIQLLFSLLICQNQNINLDRKFDFIVVGGGSAGSVVANRLSENPDVNILLLEAGDCPPFSKFIPGNIMSPENNNILWQFPVVPQTNAFFSFYNQQPNCVQGKLLGGGSGVNVMQYNRGTPYDYDHWKSLGVEDWAWSNVLPYFLIAEGNTIPGQRNDTTYHNTLGPTKVSLPPYSTPTQDAFLRSAVESHYEIVDFNGASQTGFNKCPLTTFDGTRSSTFTDYLLPAWFRKNIVIQTKAFVTKVLFNETNHAIGVECILNNETRIIYASKEVILSAGTLGSPKILMLSGIGNSTTLQDHKIEVVADLPGVGSNLHDHVACSALIWKLNCTDCTYNITTAMSPENLKNWLLNRNGPLTLPTGMEAVGFINTRFSNATGKQPDVQLIYLSTNMLRTGFFYNFDILQDDAIDYLKAFDNVSAINIVAVNIHPLSRGSLTIKSSDPRDSPLLNFNYLGNDQDAKVLVEGMKEAVKLVDSPAFQIFAPQLNPLTIRSCKKFMKFSDDYWECMVRHLTLPFYHPVGTCKMGNASDNMAVVNSNLQVYKVHGLRVIDCSIMPQIVSGAINAPAIMIGEKASVAIKKLHNI